MENKKKKKVKINLSKRQKQTLAISLSLIALTVLFAVLAICLKEKNLPTLNKENGEISGEENREEISDNSSGAVGGVPIEYEKIVHLSGNSTITPEREVLLESGIIKTIEKTSYLIPVVNENGSYYTDENGFIVCNETKMRDYTGMRENLIIIANSFADDGYPIEPIWYAQRLYFECYDYLTDYTSEEIIEGLKKVILKTGNTIDGVSFRASEVFGIQRTDECRFVFEDTLAPAEIAPAFFEVEINIPVEWKDEYEKYCIYDEWVEERGINECDRNLEHTLHTIVCKMAEKGASEYDIRLAQLIYSSYLAYEKYTPEWLLVLYDAFEEGTPDYVLLCENMRDIFGEDMNGNKTIADYYDGISKHLGGEK